MTDKTFFLGVGAQKAGTTWLHSWLETSPSFSSGVRKEYHIWDALTVPEMAHLRIDQARLTKQAEGIFARTSPFHGKSLTELAGLALRGARVDPAKPNLAAMLSDYRNNPQRIRMQMQASSDAYFDYFAQILSQKGIQATADITPSYSGLSRETLALIRDGFQARGIAVRVIFLMRDPVDRSFSHARMAVAMARAKGRETDDPKIWLDRHYADDLVRFRTDYPSVVANIQAVFRPEETLIGLYENLFTAEGLKRLSDFTALPLDPSHADQKVHVGLPAELPEDLERKVAQQYRHVYDWAAQNHPEVRGLWKGFTKLD